MKQLNFRHLTLSVKKYFKQYFFFPERNKNGSKKANIILFSIKEFSVILQQFISDLRRLPKIPEDCRTFRKTNEEVRPLPKMFEEPAKHLIVFSSETINPLKKFPIKQQTLKVMGK